jgi:hypothetical protein
MADNKDLNNSETIDMDVQVPNVIKKSELDINKNVGKFGQSKKIIDVTPETVATVEKIEHEAKVEVLQQKQEQVKINFNKFDAVRTTSDSLLSRIQVRMASILGNKKGLILT